MTTPPRSTADLDARKRQLLAALMKEQGIDPLSAPILPLERDRPFYPQSFEQERLWVIDQIEPGNAAYNLPSGLLLVGPLDRGVMEATFTEVVRRHFVLRTTYGAGPGGEAVQVVQPPEPVRIPVVDLTALPPERRGPEYRRQAFEEAVRPFDLARGPVLRLHLFHLAPRPLDGEGKAEHVLLLNIHHIASDGWSNGVLMRELSELYPAFLAGRPSPLPELAVQYVDFAHWQRKALSGPTLEKALAFWRRQLAGSRVLELPGDRPRPAVQGLEGAAAVGAVPRDAIPGLRELARGEGATLFMLLAAAFELLLARYSGQADFNVGTPVTNRPRTELEALIGFFVNTVVLRADLSGEPTFRELVGRVRKTVLESFAHQQLPFSKVVEAVKPERSLAHTPLFQVMIGLGSAATFGMESYDPDEVLPDLPPPDPDILEFQSLGADRDTAMFDLNLSLVDAGWGISASLEHRTDLFDRPTVHRMLAHYGELLRGAVADPGRPVSEIPLLTEAERFQLRHEWTDTARDWDRGRCLHELVEEQAARTPEAPAVEHRGLTLTYRELLGRSRALAAQLQSLGVGPEVRVGVCLRRDLDLPVALLGVLQAGGAYVPLDVNYPAERLRLLLEDSGAAVLITREDLQDRLPRSGAESPRLVILSEAKDLGDGALSRAAGEGWGGGFSLPQNLAYLIYTSGSTGRPKAVAIEHRSAVALVRWAAETFPPEHLRAVLASTSINFDMSVFEFFATLALGGRMVLVEDALRLAEIEPPADLSFLNTVPSAAAELVRAGALPSSLRVVGLGGEPLPRRLVERVHALVPEAAVWNLYGPSEDTTYSTVSRYEAGFAGPVQSIQSIHIGRPLPGSRIYLLDPAGQLVPQGVPGELFLAGEGLARGYLGQPGLTAERFVPDPFGTPGSRLYRTGDLARWRTSGELDYLGRRDYQVKVRGFRVELGEIETVLAAHPQVRECAVLALEQGGAHRLAAYVVPLDGVSGADLRSWLRARLPEHMVPSSWVALDALPLNPNGKVDRRALAGQGSHEKAAPSIAAESYAAPRDPVEEGVAGIWAAVLGADRPVGIHDNFFDLGGHSLLATQVVTRLREAFAADLPIRALFESPTVAELARRIEAAGDRSPSFEIADLEPRRRGQDRFPLSFSQERLWLLDQIEPDSPAYNMPSALRLLAPADPGLLARVLTEIARRHEVLRTTYGSDKGQPVQIVHPPAPVPVPVIDLTALPAAVRETEARRLADEEANAPFDLQRGPVLRARLLRLRSEGIGDAFLLTMHHIASDGWSAGVLIGEVAALAAFDVAFAQGQASPLPELPLQYADFARWQRRAFGADALAASLEYWRRKLAAAPVLELPADRPRPPVQSLAGATEPALVPAETTAALRDLARQGGATLFMAVTAGFQALLSRYSHQTDLTVGTPVAGRNRTELEPLIGFFVNTLVLRTDLGGDPSFGEILRRVREGALEAFAHQEVPFEKLVEEINPERSLAHSPLFQVMVVLHAHAAANTGGVGAPAAGGLALEPFEITLQTTKFDLSLNLGEMGGELTGTLEYRTDLFEPATVRRLAGHFATLLAGVAADPGRRLSDLPLLPEAERRQILEDWGRGEPASPEAGRLVMERIAARAAESPGAPAVLAGGRQVTLGELHGQATRWARRLRELGVGPEVRVGVCLERSPEWIAALLAVLQAGGAYVPLDPAYPRERLAFLAEDSGMSLLLASRRTAAALPELAGLPRIGVEELEAGGSAGEIAVPLDLGLDPGNAAYVIYTSGSTGRPKGVVIPHRGLANLVPNAVEILRLGPGDRFLQFASPSFDASVVEVFATLAAGACVVLPLGDGSPSGSDLAAVLRDQDVTTAVLAPSVLATVADPPASFPALRVLSPAAEKCPADLARRWSGGRRLVNLYGPTEASVFVTSWATEAELRRGDGGGGGDGAPPIGRPAPGIEARVVDPAGQLVPAGVPGELLVGGVALARGYLGRPGLTAAAFVPDPFSGQPGERLYRTGDRVRWRPDGNLDILGRIDQQVKVRGIRIEPGEIESLLHGHPGVAQAAVVADPSAARLLAFYVPRPEAPEPEPAQLRDQLRGQLPEALVPAFFTRLDALPLTPNGKLDRRALGRLAVAPAAAGAEAPRTPAEERLAGIWAAVLGVERVGIHDNFFELGGHSLLATQLVSRVREAFQVEIPQRALFEAPTVAGLAERIAGALPEGEKEKDDRDIRDSKDGRDERTDGREHEMPLSFAQQRLWFLDRLEPDSPLYNLFVAVPVGPGSSPAVLAACFGEIARRHESLRTTFAEREGEPVQVIHPPAPVPLPVIDLTALPSAGQAAETGRLAAAEAARPFDLARGPLLRVRLLCHRDGGLLLGMMHHIISDGWSMGVFRRELETLYEAFSQGRPSPLPPPPVQYADFAAWQRRWLAGERLDAEIAHWRQRLAGIPAVLELPLDRPRPPARTFRGADVPVLIPGEVARGVAALSQRTGATAFMTLLAAFQALLGRVSAKEDLTVGTPIAGRNRVEIEGLIGFFVNTLVLRGDLAGDPAFEELVARSREAALDAFAHQDLPFEKLVEALEPERSLSHSALFQVMFSLQSDWLGPQEDAAARPAETMEAPDAGSDLAILGRAEGALSRASARGRVGEGAFVNAEPAPSPTLPRFAGEGAAAPEPMEAQGETGTGLAKFDLTLTLNDSAAGLSGTLNYNADLFDRPTALRLAGAFGRLLRAAVEEPGRRLSELPLLSAAERHQLQVEWNDTARRHREEGLCLHDLFRLQAAQTPDAPAVAFEGEVLTYRDLDRRTNRLAHHLVRLGVRPDTKVGLLSHRRLEMAIGLLGILKAGGTYVPLDPGAPRERLEMLLEDTGAPVVLTAGGAPSLPSLPSLTVVPLDTGWEAITGPEDTPPDSGAVPENGAYVIYTSGSTGKPKGVVIEHRQILHYVWGIEDRAGLTGPIRYAMVQPLTVDACKTVVFPSLLRGGVLHLIEEGRALDPRGLAAYMQEHGIDLLKAAPSHLAALQSGAATEDLLPRGWLIFGGEASRLDWAQDLDRRGGGCRIYNHYGPTETTVGMLTGRVWPETTTGPSLTTPLGRPLDDVRIYNVDARGNLVPVGVPGELWIGGAYVARGYLGRPDLTADRFLPDPFADETGARLYRTGDLVRLLRDGRVEFLGRIDHQVKIRGFRIELGEIDAALARHPGVAEGLTAARPDASGSLRLVGYVVPKGEMPSPEDLQRFLSDRLPEYMVPAAFVALDELPRTAHGKVDRKLLPEPESWAGAGGTMAAAVEPRTPAEDALAEIWRDVLGLGEAGRVSVRDDFFSAGGHSLLAVRLMARIRSRFGRDLPLSLLFQRPTIERLAEVLERPEEGGPRKVIVEIQPEGEGAPLFFVHAVGGNVLGYADLARRLGDLGRHRPFLGIQSPDPDAGLPETLEALASLYIEQARASQPAGPWRLGGWSMGAQVAWEMARQLREQGEEVERLTLVDPPPPGLFRPPLSEAELALSFASDLAGVQGVALSSETELADVPDSQVLPRLFEGVRAAGLLPPEVGLEDVRRLFETFKHNNRVLAAYRPGPYAGSATLVLARASGTEDIVPSWRQLLGGELEVHVLEGDHYSILREPRVEELARILW